MVSVSTSLKNSSLLRHGRACPGDPRASRFECHKDVDARHKAGHDELYLKA
jgi:hypothetical protein